MTWIVVASVLGVLLPALFLYYHTSKNALLQSELAEAQEQTQLLVDLYQSELKSAEASLNSLAHLIKRSISQSNTEDSHLFEQRIAQSSDGAWRNKRDTFDGTNQTGLFLPPDIEVTPSLKQYFGKLMTVFDVFGASSTTNPVFDNVWLLGHDRSELIFDLSYPDFVYLMNPDTDYTSTPWMTLASPENNPQRTAKWTPALFDHVSQIWMVSVVQPLDIKNQWRGTLGHDVQLEEMLSLLATGADNYKGEQRFLRDGQGGFVLAGPWQQYLQENSDTFVVNSQEHQLIEALNSTLSNKATLLPEITLQNEQYQVIGMTIAPMEWVYLRLIPTKQILKPLVDKILRTSLVLIIVVLLLGFLIHRAVRKLIVNPVIELVARARDYAGGRKPQILSTRNNNELNELAQALDDMHADFTKESIHLVESEKRYRRVVDNIREVVVQIDDKGHWSFLSPAWRYLTGSDNSASLNKHVSAFLHPSDEHVINQILKSLNKGLIQSWFGEVRFKTIDQRYRWVAMSLQSSADLTQKSTIVGTLEDINVQRLTREVNRALRTAEQMVLTTGCTMPVLLEFITQEMVQILELPLVWVKVCREHQNTQLYKAGIKADFLYDNHGIWQGLHDEDGPVMKVVRDYTSLRLTSHSTMPDSWRQRLNSDDINDSLFLPFKPSVEYRGVIGIHSDIPDLFDTEYQRVMDSFASGLRLICHLADDQQLMRLHQTAVEKTANAIMITDTDGCIEWVNDAFVRLTMYQLDDVIGHTPRLMKSDQHKAGYAEAIWQTITAGEVWHGEITNRRKDGKLFTVYQTITPLIDQDGVTTHFIAVLEDVTERNEAQDRITYLATHDELTELPNRTLLQDRLSQAITQAHRRKTKMAVLFLDIDQFKYINDSLGHQYGDELLKVITQRLLDSVRAEDTVARFGGDEFVVVFPAVNLISDVSKLAQKLLSQIKQPYQLAGHDLTVTGSIGISLYPDDALEPDELIQHADSAMYLAKEKGRNNSQFYTREINEKNLRRLNLEKALRKALRQREFVLHYQPKIDLHTGNIMGMEALVRWQHPEMGLVSPMEFIPLAEETGIILSLGEWVIQTACEQMKQWLMEFPWLENMAINLSARQFWQAGFTKQTGEILQVIGVPAEKIEFELTESLVMNDVDAAIQMMSDLKSLGVSLSIDDFGTGYSSLSYLKRFPVDVLKIDRSFVKELDSDSSDHAIVRSIIALADNLNLKVVAEGVERVQQHDILALLGCQYAQGYFFSRPVATDEMTKLLAKQYPQPQLNKLL